MISVVVSTLAVPPLLALLGAADQRRADRPPPHPRRSRSTVAAAAGAALRRPALAAALVAVPLVLLMLPILAFTTGAPGIDELPTSNQARQSAETIDAAVGPGWEAPFILVAATERGPITTKRKLALLARWQRRIAAEPGIRAVIGPGPIAEATTPLRRLGKSLAAGADGPIPPLRAGNRPVGRGLASWAGSGPGCAGPPALSSSCGVGSRRAPRAAGCWPRAPNARPPAPG